ncbi:putative small secreted protein [Streptomyces sp. V4I8]|uniref:DUF4232 domain-containing protein n=1 Tax=Streptomyces sp. V4I8 TaxID=3156469 RepID=UPI003518F7FC
MSTSTHRTRMLVAAALTAATLTLTACNSGEGVKDEGASAGSASTAAPTASSTSSGKASGGTSTGAGQTDTVGSTSGGSTGGAAGSSGTTGSTGSSGSTGSTGSSGSNDPGPTRTACSPATTRTAATEVTRPLNHLLLTVTNTGSKNCNLTGYPAVRFGEAQSVPPAFEDSKPQAVVTLAPGESGYASVLLSAADGSGSNGYTAKSLAVYFNTSANTAAHPSLPAKGVHVDDSIGVSYWQSTMADALAW